MASIQKRVRNGRTSYSVRYRDPAGRSRRKDFQRKADAERWLVANEAAKLKGGWVDPAAGKLRFAEQAERWYATTAALRPATRRDYRKSLDLYVLPTFGDLPLASIDPLAVREWQAALAVGTSPGRDGKALGAKRRAKALAVLRMVLASAVEAGRLARNPAETVKPPKVQRREVRVLDPVQVELLADCIDPRWRVMVLFAAYTGLRPEELTALRVEHLDLLRGTVRVCEAAPEIDGRLCWGGVKTHEARTVRLPRFLVEELAAYLAGRPHEP
ncbi:MAG TPA: tyrosine-type recombinase/integrase, partial [Gemmataceae bacterium]